MTKSTLEKSSTQNKQNSLVSYQLSATKIISNALFDEKCTDKINEFPLSNTTAKRRIDEMSESVKEAVMIVLKQSEYFSLQHDESTDVAGQANLLTFGRFKFNGKIEEEILLCHPFPTNTTGEEIFQ
ncbi:Zinc finger BED domain-containing protein 5 [Araneus ventricosus]|uniref:Zinc finger BED domain-containing protein 5 n=1 Tax=Araneus ventricosus TaxID=182803 RepID=A0A4Y2M886_ARAVE|nr:Zinc finger BED domain-containing protein 5 [Araneus ventricosus]